MMAIDNKSKEDIKFLYNEKYKDNVENDIIFEMHDKNELNLERLQLILENCNAYQKISSFIKQLMKINNR